MIYNFQNFLTLTIETGGRHQFDAYFENEYARINETDKSETTSDCCVTLVIVSQIPGDLPPDAIHRVKRFKKLFTFEFAIVGLGTKNTKIYFKDHMVRRVYVTAVGVFLQAQVLEPVIYHSLLQQKILLMHSAGVSKDGKAYLFPAHGGTGKTTTSMSLLSKGYDFLGDDLILVDPVRKKAYPYPRPLHIFTYNVRNLNGAKIPPITSFIIYFKNVLRFFLEGILRTEFLISTRVHADEILPDLRLSAPVDLHNIIFLKKEGDHESIDLTSEDAIAKHAEAVATSADLNESLFEIIENSDASAEIRDREIEGFSALLRNATYFGYLNTRRINLNQVDTYLNNVEAPHP